MGSPIALTAIYAVSMIPCVPHTSDFPSADHNPDVHPRGETALHGAAFRGVNAVVDLLVERGARLDATTVEGWTPLALANGLSYSDFYKAQTHTADRLRALMAARGLETGGHHIDPSVCLDCFQTRPDQVRAARARDARMEAAFAAELEAGVPRPTRQR